MNENQQKYKETRSRINVLRRTAAEVRNYRIRKKVLLSALSGLVALTAVLFICSALHRDLGRLTVGMNKTDMTLYGMTLSETRDMLYCTSRLNADINERITNISIKDLPENLHMIDGQHNGENYIAYTFYLEHRGTEVVDYEYELTLSNVTLGLDEAMRVRLYVEDEYVDYARTRNDGTGPEPGTVEFYNINTITKKVVTDCKPGDKTKYTIVIWLEGDDPECVDAVIDGMAKVEMNFRVIIPEDQTD